MRTSAALAAGALAASAAAQNYLGFNSGANFPDRSAKFKKDFVEEFEAAASLKNAPGDFTAVRLYTNIQAYAEDDPIEAFEAAVETKTKVLLGVWASGTDNIDKELAALSKAVEKLGKAFTDLVIGISIGSEDLYRVSATGIKNKSNPGNGPKELVGFINDFKDTFKGTALGQIPVGHVDTWDSWENVTNKPVLDAVDWVGFNAFPYYEDTKPNNISNAPGLFDHGYEQTIAAVGGKPVWVTETGWPWTGPKWADAEASVENAKYFWDEVGCRRLFNKAPVFWYNLRDSNPDNEMEFSITDDLSTTPRFDLSCPTEFETDKKEAEASSSAAAAASSAAAAASSTAASAEASATESADGSKTSSVSAAQSSAAAGGNADEGSSTEEGSAPASSSAAPETVDESAAGSVKVMTLATYAALAVTAGVFALF